MAQPPKVEKHGEFGVTAQFVIEVQPLFIRNGFQQFFACVPSRAWVRLIAISASTSSIRIVIHWRRPRLTIDASGDTWADVCLTGRPGNRPRLTGRPGIADARALLLFMLL
jgi:hypothetical protein